MSTAFAAAPTNEIASPYTAIERSTSSIDLLHFAAQRSQIDGTEPFAISDHFESPVVPLHVLPPDATVHRVASTTLRIAVYATTSTGTVIVESGRDSADVWTSASTLAEASRLLDMVRVRVGVQNATGDVDFRIWTSTSLHGPVRSVQKISCPLWNDIASNYPDQVAHVLGNLAAVQAPTNGGKLILFHGAPGTGKSTAVKALAREWSGWCTSHLISDPERLFLNPEYLTHVLTASERSTDRPHLDAVATESLPWRLIIAEDTDEYLRATAGKQAGAALGRLLNLTDGILGDSHRVLVLLTTNEDIGELHPALIRPGRCLARAEFVRFTPQEARRWLRDSPATPRQAHTLAELFELRGDIRTIGTSPNDEAPSGLYL